VGGNWLLHQRRLSDEDCPVVGGRRLIAEDYLPTIAHALQASEPGGDGFRETAR
jgi:hypothetical protein